MYKTKLQELCQKRQWALPKYCTMKDGPDHNPSFKSSVSVNSHFFDFPFPCKSSKQAQNDAAKLAFYHFTSSPDSSNPPEPKMQETYNGSDIQSVELTVKNADSCQYKNQLQSYAHWKDLDLPVYSSITEDSSSSSESLHFKARVIINGHAIESSDFFTTLEAAENSAAKAALMSLVSDDFQEDDSGHYKNLLQELTQKEGLSVPLYRAINTGPPHIPTFFSYVEVEGKKFYGKAGKSKKEAEVKAAKVAYTSLLGIAISRIADVTSHKLATDESDDSAPGLDSIIHEQDSAENKDEELITPTYIKTDFKDPIFSLSDSIIHEQDSAKNKDEQLSHLKTEFRDPIFSTSDSIIHEQDSAENKVDSSNSSSKMEETTFPRSYMLCGRVRVYTSYPNITFPKGITVLPISDDKWVAVSLEFPNEQAY